MSVSREVITLGLEPGEVGAVPARTTKNLAVIVYVGKTTAWSGSVRSETAMTLWELTQAKLRYYVTKVRILQAER